jgi:hypothetical protein
MDTKQQIPNTITTSDTTTTQSRRMTNGLRILALVGGDLFVFLIFATIGRSSHGEEAGLDAILATIRTAAPFAAGWFLISPFVGAFKRGLEVQPGKMALRTLLSWLAAWPVAMALRIFFVDYLINHSFNWGGIVTFSLITLITNTILLLLWRWLFALINSLRRRA